MIKLINVKSYDYYMEIKKLITIVLLTLMLLLTGCQPKDAPKTDNNIPYYFIAIHNEPFHDEFKREERLADAYSVLKKMIAKADEYNIKLTLMFTAQWADYIAASPERMADLESWKKSGHEISAHHHEVYHGNWDGYTEMTKEEAYAIRKKSGKNESYLGTIKDYFEHLKKINPDMKSGCLNEEGNKDALPNEIIYATCSGFLNNGEVGVQAGDQEPRKAKNDYITVGNWNNIQRKWLNHFQITTTEREPKAEEMFNSMDSTQVSGSVTHSLSWEADSYYTFLEFLHSKDPKGKNSRTVSEIIDQKLIPEKEISDEQLIKKPTASGGTTKGRCGDGVCGPAEKADPELCPEDCDGKITNNTQAIKCGDGICDSLEKANPYLCPKDCQ